MIVYGDPLYEETYASLVSWLHRDALACASTDRGQDVTLDRLRTLLILAGQVEQATHDYLIGVMPPEQAERHIAPLNAVTRRAADAFYAAWASSNDALHKPSVSVPHALRLLLGQLERIDSLGEQPLTVKIPEGFAFYALYPEQYLVSALRWLTDHEGVSSRQAVVVGVRSIGTTLAAVVNSVLTAGGWQVNSLTVRPGGHPFAREVELSAEQLGGTTWGLVVDEGPGMSGSSMVAVAEALTRCGIARERISFFPGHGGEPGSAASEQVRGWWSGTARYVTPLREVAFEGRPLPEALAASLSGFTGEDDPVAQVDDVGGGQWRDLLYSEPSAWPAICTPFERPKYLCTTLSGQRFLCKFEGLASIPGGFTMAEAAASQLRVQAQRGWGVAPLGVAHGFVCTPWIVGTPLARSDADVGLLAQVGRYIAEAAGPPLSASEQSAAFARLREMLYWNTWEALGQEAADRARHRADQVASSIADLSARSYGDGHLAPHEWLRSHDGRLLKVDSAGHQWDHTIVGKQPLVWDAAGAIVEWGLDDRKVAILLDAFYAAGGVSIPADALNFYGAAYAAFSLGQCHMCAGMSADAEEQQRLWRAYGDYRDWLMRLLERSL